ncbi:MAG: DUF5689 domain-containing protein [Candidatus Azobacteroides sp.]|nr:DUF5689 domain-containing protein [Candidatus Azobacteroides sp.]
MKTLKNLLLLLIATLFIASCDERKFDMPPLNEPTYKYDGKVTTIQDLINNYKGTIAVLIDKEIVIKGLVVANDISGNFYNQIQLQDETGGIAIRIQQRSIYNDLRVGQEVFLECQGIWYGEYGGYPQLGYGATFNASTGQPSGVGTIPWDIFKASYHLNGFPNPASVVPIVVNIDNLGAGTDYIGKLVTVTNVTFENAGKQFSPIPAGNPTTASEILLSATATSKATLTARNSSAADFATSLMPTGIGSVTGILSIYNSTLQITFRDYNDCSQDRFSTGEGNGSQLLPWSIDYALSNQTNDPSAKGWIHGYIVGTVAPGINETNPINSNAGINFSGSGSFMNNTVVLAASADETNWEKCVVVELPSGSDIRTQVNLADNPGNLGKLLKVQGDLKNYLGAAGLTTAGASSNFEFESSTSGTIFLETFGNAAPTANPRPSIAEYTGYDNGAPIVFSGNTDVRATAGLNTSGYYSHIWFAAWSDQYPDLKNLTISGINTAGASDLKLSFDLAPGGVPAPTADVVMTVTVKDVAAGGAATSLTVPATALAATANTFSTISNITGVPATSNLEITFQTTKSNTMGLRLDNIRIDGVKP